MSTPGFSDAGVWSPSNILTIQNVVWLILSWLAYQLLKALYNVSPFHPLSHIPGPKLAAATYLPEFYYDVIKFGRYTSEIKEMHKKYGPLVRINPYEIHCNDINFSDEIYAIGGRKRDKPKHQVGGTVARRAPVARFFSRGNVAKLEDEIKEHVQMLCDKLLRQSKPFDVKTAYSCFTADIISSYAFGQSFGFLEQEGWYPNFKDPTEAALQTSHFFRFFPFLKSLDQLATLFVDYLPEDVGLFVRTMQIDLPASINQTKANVEAGLIRSDKRPTIFGSLLLEEELESTEKGTKRLAAECFAVVGAGTETTASALAVITYHLLTKPHLLAKLMAELEQFGITNSPRELPSFPDMEKLPYLGAVIQEGLRLSYGVAARTARVATEEDLIYRGEWNKKPVEHVIPRGYAVGMSTFITHHDETVFPNSDEFIPERWLDEENHRRKEVDRGQMAFSKGSRKCLAMNLALCEIHFAVAALAIRVLPRMTLFETTEDDVLYDHDMFIPMVKAGSKGIRVTVF
ncbi:trichodiene oxygenase [Diaporthe amygdali]|uniref:trichodiene oxygenase n=1 Tax=Phomopsis amygdali TaxID=1214568 RepID=UPI0022FF1164|nr:trichodiene oxygenase [Diaporthe amygdali]KAJ0123500.1 trichodiene oxygenase [Diaporthe amygdali]